MKYMTLIVLPLLAACAAPAHEDYCARYGVGKNSPEFAACSQYFFTQQAAFDTDRKACAREADVTYPPSLYSQPTAYPVRVYSPRSAFPHTEMVYAGADYQQHAQLDAMRMRIIGPCMQARGWNSPVNWEAGRHAAAKQSPTPAPSPSLPWRK